PADYAYYRWLRRFEYWQAEIAYATCAMAECPPAALEQALALLRGPFSVVHDQPGCRLRVVYQHLAEPTRLLAMVGWASRAQGEAAFQAVQAENHARLRALGARIARFHGQTRVEIQPAPPG